MSFIIEKSPLILKEIMNVKILVLIAKQKFLQLSISDRKDLREKISYYYFRAPEEDKVDF